MPLSVPRGVYHYGGDKVVHGLYDIESLLQEKRRAIRVGEKVCHRFQLCVVGDVDQGKTSTVRSLTGQVFRQNLPNTEGVDVRRLASVVHADRAWTVVSGGEEASAAAANAEVESLLAEHVAGECARRAREQPAGRLRCAYSLLIALSLVAGPVSLAVTGYTTLAAVANVTCACLVLGVTCTSVRLALSFTNVSALLLIVPPLGFGCGGDAAAALECAAAFSTSATSHFLLGFLTGFGFGPGLTTGAMLMRAPEALFNARRRLVQIHFGSGDILGQTLAVALTVASCCTALLLTTFWKRAQSTTSPPAPKRSKPSSWASPLAWNGGGGCCVCVAAVAGVVAVVAATDYFKVWLSQALQLCLSHTFWWFTASFFVGALTLAGVVAGRRGGAAVAPVAITPWQVIVNVYTYFLPGVAASTIALWLAGWTLDGPTDAAAKLCLGYGLSKVSAAFDYLRDVAPPAPSCATAAEEPGRSSTGTSSSAQPCPSAQPSSAAAVEIQSCVASSAASTTSAAVASSCSAVVDSDGCQSPSPPTSPQPPLGSFRMVIRDFAGHSVYRPMQQAFMPRSSFYLVVFSWLDADRDVNDCAARLTAWLALVLAHVGAAASETGSGAATSAIEAAAAAADGSVLLVGTHAGDVAEARRRELDVHLQRAVQPKALRLLRCRAAGELAFSVENSLGPDEPGVTELRRVMSAEARLKALAFFPRRIPLRWWEWLSNVAAPAPSDSLRRCRAEPFESADRLYVAWRSAARDLHQVDVLRQDFDEMISFFHDIGEVYVVRAPAAVASVAMSPPGSAAEDGGGSSSSSSTAYVFLDVQFIADAAAAVAAGEPLGDQPPGLREEWRRLSTLGVCRMSFLRRIVDDKLIGAGRQPTTTESFSVLASLLERLDLLHRVDSAVLPPSPGAAAVAATPWSGDRRQDAAASVAGDQFIFVPERLPPAADDQLWAPAKPCDQQVDVYVRVEAFTADQLLYRLLCRCAAGCAFEGGCGLSLYRNATEFQTIGGVFLMRVRPGCRNSVVVVSVRAQSSEHCGAIVRLVSDAVKEIVDRDFPYLSWSLNVLCPLDGHTDATPGYRDTDGLHLIHSTPAFANPDAKIIVYCRGRPLVIHRYRIVIQKLYHRPSLNSVVSEDVVEKLVVEQLNTDDFKRLSSALGLSRIEVNNIMAANSHSSRDGRLETMRLWMSRKGEEATYAALVQALAAKELREAASYVCLLLEEDVTSGQHALRSGSFSESQPHSFYSTASARPGGIDCYHLRLCGRGRHGGDHDSDESMQPLSRSVGSSAIASEIAVGIQANDVGSRSYDVGLRLYDMPTPTDGESTDYPESTDDR